MKKRLRPYQWGEGVLSLAVPPIFTRSLRLLSDTSVGFVINSSTYYSQYAFAVSSLPALVSAKIQTDVRASIESVTWIMRLRLLIDSPERLQGEFTGSIHRFAPPTGSLKNLSLLLLLFTAFVQNCESHHKKTGSVRQLFCFSGVVFGIIKQIATPAGRV
jgi:hypothetical protein